MIHAVPSLPLVAVGDALLLPHAAGSRLALEAPRAAGALVPGRDVVLHSGRPEVGALAVAARVLEVGDPGDGSLELLLLGLERVELVGLVELDGGPGAVVRPVPTPAADARDCAEAAQRCLELLGALERRQPRPGGVPAALARSDPDRFADRLAGELDLAPADLARLVGEPHPARRLELLERALSAELARRRAGARAADPRSAAEWPGSGSDGPLAEELRDFERRLERAGMNAEARRRARRELAHLAACAPGSAEAGRLRGWLERLLELPWTSEHGTAAAADAFQSVAAELGGSHVGLEDVKNRVSEYLAVRQLGGAARGTVLCFLGPPGTGKTSMGRAVARALGRPFVHVPLGGVNDESDLRGLPHTLGEGAPGHILTGLARAASRNPVILFDEIDKVQFGTTGETGGVLLDVLDPEQSREFVDQYFGVPFDLSQCIFLATANDTESMPESLLDRMEVIEFHSYTEAEKLAIARDHLIPRARRNAGLEPGRFKLSRGALLAILRKYTEEAGVRQLQRVLDSLARKAALRLVREGQGLNVRKADLLGLLGPSQVDEDLALRRPRVGFGLGLAWTSAGGSTLPIEAASMPGSGRTILTGSVGDVLRESVQTAMSYVRGCIQEYGIDQETLDALDLHLHFPSASSPKDGPSAGIAIATALFSLLTRTPVRHDVAMTGELSLHGTVLPVGGLRDKLLAALRAGATTVIVPARNGEEVLRLPAEVRQRLTIHLVQRVPEALAKALLMDRGPAAGRGAAARGRQRARAARRAEGGSARRPRRRGRAGS